MTERTTMRLGLHYWNYSTPTDPAAIAPTLAETARIADEDDYDAIDKTVMPDRHPVQYIEEVVARVLPRLTDLG